MLAAGGAPTWGDPGEGGRPLGASACAALWSVRLPFFLFAPALNQAEGAARLRAAPARARRGRLSINTPMPGTPPSTWANLGGSICIMFNDDTSTKPVMMYIAIFYSMRFRVQFFICTHRKNLSNCSGS